MYILLFIFTTTFENSYNKYIRVIGHNLNSDNVGRYWEGIHQIHICFFWFSNSFVGINIICLWKKPALNGLRWSYSFTVHNIYCIRNTHIFGIVLDRTFEWPHTHLYIWQLWNRTEKNQTAGPILKFNLTNRKRICECKQP